jgi:endonuclease G
MGKKKKKGRSNRKTFGFMGITLFFLVVLLTHDCAQQATVEDNSLSGPEIPALQNGRMEQIIRHEGFTVSYNSDYRIANWVAYELTEAEARAKDVSRTDVFVPDPQVAADKTATNNDYYRSGYDRGHLAPAGDMKWSATAMQESFYLSNICPQNKGLNGGIWNDLEKQCRQWAIRYGSVLIITGPIIKEHPKRIGNVGVPSGFYKVVCIRQKNGKQEGIGFIYENRGYKNTTFRSGIVSVDSVEKVTGIDFFPSFPIEVQQEMEASTSWKN